MVSRVHWDVERASLRSGGLRIDWHHTRHLPIRAKGLLYGLAMLSQSLLSVCAFVGLLASTKLLIREKNVRGNGSRSWASQRRMRPVCNRGVNDFGRSCGCDTLASHLNAGLQNECPSKRFFPVLPSLLLRPPHQVLRCLPVSKCSSASCAFLGSSSCCAIVSW